MLSVIIPTCDRPAELAATLTALAEQTEYPHQVIIVDNGREPLAGVPDTPLPVRLLRAPVRCGAAQARNIGAACATTPWLAFLDDDDRWSPEYIERLGAAIRAAPQVTVRLARLQVIDAAGNHRPADLYAPQRMRELLYKGPASGGSNIAVERAAWARVGGFDVRLPSREDAAFVWALLRSGEPVGADAQRTAWGQQHAGPRLSDLPTWLSGRLRFWWLHARWMRPYEHLATLAVIGYGLWRRATPSHRRARGR